MINGLRGIAWALGIVGLILLMVPISYGFVLFLESIDTRGKLVVCGLAGTALCLVSGFIMIFGRKAS